MEVMRAEPELQWSQEGREGWVVSWKTEYQMLGKADIQESQRDYELIAQENTLLNRIRDNTRKIL